MMDKISNRFINQVQVLQKKLEGLLEKDWGPASQPSPTSISRNQLFEVQTDLSDLSPLSMALPLRDPERTENLFLRMHPFFEAGFCFSLSKNPVFEHGLVETFHNWNLQAAFLQGQKLRISAGAPIEIALPSIELTDIKKIPSSLVRSDLATFSHLVKEEWSCLVFRVSEDFLWIVFSNLPDLFLRDHVKTLHEKTLRVLADFAELK